MKNINWWKVLNKVLHILTLGLAKAQTLVEAKAKKKDQDLLKAKVK